MWKRPGDQFQGAITGTDVERGKFQPIKSKGTVAVLSGAVKSRTECKTAVKELAHAFRPVTSCESKSCPKEFRLCLPNGFRSWQLSGGRSRGAILELIQRDEQNCNFVRGVNGVRETLAAVEGLALDQTPEVQGKLLHLFREIRARKRFTGNGPTERAER